jgi:hypothetical protein
LEESYFATLHIIAYVNLRKKQFDFKKWVFVYNIIDKPGKRERRVNI